jgi:hypothetical protein
MKRMFDPEAVKAQIENLLADRERIDQAINALQMALRSVEGAEGVQTQLSISINASGITLLDSVRAVASRMKDGITRQRVIMAIEREHPFLKPKSSSVAAALINLTKGDNPMLRVAIEGHGRSPSHYSTEGDTTVRLHADEIAVLTDTSALKGSGGWQSLWAALLKRFDKSKGEITLTPELRAKIYHYYHRGEGGWQTKIMRIFRREFPHLFVS